MKVGDISLHFKASDIYETSYDTEHNTWAVEKCKSLLDISFVSYKLLGEWPCPPGLG